MKLEEYKNKRNFDKTSEPFGKKMQKKTEKLRYVIQYHVARKTHFDLRLEHDGVLISFAVPKGPSFNIKDKRLAVKVEDHPVEYANFEGVIPKGEYGGGVVMLWDKGYYEPLKDFNDGLKKGILKFEIFGERIKGKWTLIKLKNSEKEENWLLIKEKDAFAKASAGISKFKTSVKTGLNVNEIEANENKITKNPFKTVDVKLAKLVDEVPSGKDYLYEIKYDGYRIVAFVENESVKLITRNNNDFTCKFILVEQSLLKFSRKRSMVLDGEMVVFDKNGKSDFGLLQNVLNNEEKYEPIYIVFDILALDGENLRRKPLIKRKAILKDLFIKVPKNIMFSDHVLNKGKDFFNLACTNSLEGIIAKKINSEYNGLRDDNWLKIKCYKRQEFVIGGYTKSSKKTHGISSLLLGVYKNNNLIYVGKAGTGINHINANELKEKFKKLEIKKSPFKNSNKIKEKVVFLMPELIAEIQFAELTKENLLRQASFKGLREDKLAKEVKLENESKNEIVVAGIEISSPEKIIFEKYEITKLEVVNYYKTVAKRMLKFIENRLLSVVRCNNGLANCFYKKHPNNPLVKTKRLKYKENENSEYFYITDEKGLISEVQFGTVEFHIWGSKVSSLNTPDIMVFDLDPDENLSLEKLRGGVRDLKSVLNSLKLKSFLKTSGGKGYHIVVPFTKSISYNKFRDFSEKIANIMVEKWPDKYTNNVRKENRKGKIYIDYLRNSKGATSVAPYSLRAREGAKVSMPICWKELNIVAPDDIDIKSAVERIKKVDPWKNFFNIKQELK